MLDLFSFRSPENNHNLSVRPKTATNKYLAVKTVDSGGMAL
jgi:hypothetical protein